MTRRAITLAGGGPAAGLHIGVLQRLAEAGMRFDVWALSCIGAWVGIVYNQCEEGKESEQTYEFFNKHVFRNDLSYDRFPINSVFGPDWFGNTRALMTFIADPKNYENILVPEHLAKSWRETASFFSRPSKWTEGDFNQWVLNHALAPNPFVRFLASMMYLSPINGLSKIYYPESEFMKSIKFDRLYSDDKPFIFHNAWNLDAKRLDLFSNKPLVGYKDISAGSLCACSALPFVEGTVDLAGSTYCEGALVDTVNFYNLVQEDHFITKLDEDPFTLDEIWISRIVDAKQIRKPENLHDGLANLCQLFAATVGEDDVSLFKYHTQKDGKWRGTVVEIRVDSGINFDWSHDNLEKGRVAGYMAADEALKAYKEAGETNKTGKFRVINEQKSGTAEALPFALREPPPFYRSQASYRDADAALRAIPSRVA